MKLLSNGRSFFLGGSFWNCKVFSCLSHGTLLHKWKSCCCMNMNEGFQTTRWAVGCPKLIIICWRQMKASCLFNVCTNQGSASTLWERVDRRTLGNEIIHLNSQSGQRAVELFELWVHSMICKRSMDLNRAILIKKMKIKRPCAQKYWYEHSKLHYVWIWNHTLPTWF